MDIEKINSIRRSLADTAEDEKDRLFTDKEIDDAIRHYGYNENKLLSVLYIQKAGRLITNENYIKSIKAGNEELMRLNASELQAMALKQAEEYKNLYEWEEKINEASSIVY